jgi:hypothetical protein
MAKQPKVYGPCSEVQRKFLDSDAFFVIYGGGRYSGAPR